jgi:hypothetical protein
VRTNEPRPTCHQYTFAHSRSPDRASDATSAVSAPCSRPNR